MLDRASPPPTFGTPAVSGEADETLTFLFGEVSGTVCYLRPIDQPLGDSDMTRLRYDPITQSLHWIIAVAVIATYAIGLIREDLPKGDFRNWLLSFHMSLGLLIAGLTVVRLGWRGFNPAPPALTGPAATLAARLGHLVLYLALFAIPLIGLAAAWSKGRTVGVFGLVVLPSPLPLDKPFAEQLEEFHGLAAHVLVILAGAHALVAIVHQFVFKDGTLGRMLPFLRPAPAAE